MPTNDIAMMTRGKLKDKAGTTLRPSKKCRCGQELDVCSRSHCPRCGSNLPRS